MPCCRRVFQQILFLTINSECRRIQFRKSFTERMVSITLFEKLKNKKGVLSMNMRTYSCKTDKLRSVYTIGRGARNISIKKWNINFG